MQILADLRALPKSMIPRMKMHPNMLPENIVMKSKENSRFISTDETELELTSAYVEPVQGETIKEKRGHSTFHLF